MRAPGGRTGKRSAAAAGAMVALRAAARAQNRAVAGGLRPSRGISSASVFQNASSRPEKKFLDVTTATALTFGSAVGLAPVLLNGCAQGTDANQHIGRQTTMRSLYWLWEGNVAPTTTGTSPIRMVIVYDKEAEGAAPTLAAGLQTDIFNADNITAQMNLNNRDRFIVLVDEIVECVGTAGPQSFYRKGYRKVQLPCVFNASAAATVVAINTGSVYATFWQNGSLLVANVPFVLQTRIRFTDN